MIAYSGSRGIVVSGAGNELLGNAIWSNGDLGMDLMPLGPTPNDTGDADTGANNLQNFPVLTSATSGGSASVQGTLNSTSSTQFRLEFFSSTTCDPSGHGEGENFIGFKDVTTDGAGNVSFTATFSTTVSVGDVITAAATDPSNNTSEFSACQAVAAAPTPTPTPVPGITLPGLAAMAGMLALALVWALRRKGLSSSTP